MVHNGNRKLFGNIAIAEKICKTWHGSGTFEKHLEFSSCRNQIIERYWYTTEIRPDKDYIKNKFSKYLNTIYSHYEEFVGLAEVQDAQEEVKKVCCILFCVHNCI